MKKKVSFVSTIVIAVFTTAVLASGIISFDSAPLSTPPETEFIPTPAMEAVESNLSSKENLRSADSFASVANCTDSAKYHNVTAYTAFMGENSFTSSQLEIINRILDKGTTIQSLAQVYDFWLTTSEPFSIIEDICALEERYFSEFWYENAFNALTNDKCGVLDSKDIDEYKEKDITAEQILAANTLCRKGKYTITEILDMAVNGRDIEDIACEIYEIDSLPEADSLNEKINLVIEAKKLNISDKAVADIKSLVSEYSVAVTQRAVADANRMGIDKPRDTKEDYELLESTGLPIGTINALLNKGFTPAEIAKVPEMDTDDIFAAAKTAREVLTNE